VDVLTPQGTARAEVHEAAGARALMALGHGAGGGFGAADLVAARDAALDAGVTVVTIEQPYKVAGRRVAPTGQLDIAWVAAVSALLELRDLGELPLIFGGRSSGARVACRTASEFDQVVGVLCLAFPEHPPGRPEKSRIAELDGVTVPVLVVVGEHEEPESRASAEALAGALANAEVVTLAGAGRRVVAEQPDALARAVQQFLEGLA
jgi:predicted alpha/beta-hydrolase family hydrolase